MKHLYILRSISQPEQNYIGITADLSQRLRYHNSGMCRYTSKFMPWEIVYTEEFMDDAVAWKRERQLKGWTRAKREALICGDRSMLKKLSQCRNR